jgi:hypothetical protein
MPDTTTESGKPCCPAGAARMIKKLALPGGHQVGIAQLDSILEEIADMHLADDSAIKTALLERVKVYNYVAPGAEPHYSDALLAEYNMLTGGQT